jgi:hypothetical protein
VHLNSTGSVARRLLQCVLFTFLIPDASSAQKPTAEDLRDLSRPVEPGAVALGLGGSRGAGLGDATDVASNPATVVLGPAGDVVISIGGYRYGRRELQRTRAGEGVADSWTIAVANPEPIGSVAAARRGRRFAVGGFYDATSRLDFSRSIDRVRRTGASAGEAWTDERQVSLGVRHERLGAGVGAVLPGGFRQSALKSTLSARASATMARERADSTFGILSNAERCWTPPTPSKRCSRPMHGTSG